MVVVDVGMEEVVDVGAKLRGALLARETPHVEFSKGTEC